MCDFKNIITEKLVNEASEISLFTLIMIVQYATVNMYTEATVNIIILQCIENYL